MGTDRPYCQPSQVPYNQTDRWEGGDETPLGESVVARRCAVVNANRVSIALQPWKARGSSEGVRD